MRELPFMSDLGQIEVPDKVFWLAEFLRWNDTTINVLKEIYEE